MFNYWDQLVEWVSVTYKVNPYIFIIAYAISVPFYLWGLYEIAVGSPLSIKYKHFDWPKITKGLIVNRVAWIFPYLYVMLAVGYVPAWLLIFLVGMALMSSAYFIREVTLGKARHKLPKFLRAKLYKVK